MGGGAHNSSVHDTREAAKLCCRRRSTLPTLSLMERDLFVVGRGRMRVYARGAMMRQLRYGV